MPTGSQTTTRLCISPPELDVLINQDFSVSLCIEDVANLSAWQTYISFDPNLMNCTGAVEGPFLRNVGPTIWPEPVIDNEAGTILIGDALLIPGPGATGSGVLAYINFTCKAYGASTLHLYDSQLLDVYSVEIPHETMDGEINQGYKNLHSEEPLVPVHMHSNKSLVPVHMHSNVTLTPVHMHFTGPEGVDPIYEPICTWWHELYPEYCQEWHLTSWKDNGDGMLSVCDQIDMTNLVTEEVKWYHVDRITYTLLLSDPEFPDNQMAIEFKGPLEVNPVYDPIGTYWHEVWPIYSYVYQIVDWQDNGNGVLDYCDYIQLDDGTIWHVEDLATDIILREKIAYPISTWWHELHPEYSQWRHLTSWEDNGDGFLSPSDQIGMTEYASEEEMWDIFWSMGDVNRDGYIDETDLNRILDKFGWTGPPGGIPEDINSDGVVDTTDVTTCEQNQGLIFWTYFYKWYHVDRVTLTLNVSKASGEYMLIEFKGSYEELYTVLSWPIETLWHEVYPSYSNTYVLTAWDWWTDDNCNGVLDACDYIWLYNQSSGLEERYHVDDICYDIILNEKLTDPRCTWWHELYPEYCQEWHLTSWEEPLDDPYPLRLSPGDQIDMINSVTGEKKWYYVDRVTFTMLLSNVSNPEITMYIEYKGSFEGMYKVKTNPWGSLWHEVWPSYSESYEITDWSDNCNGVLDYCDLISFDGGVTWWHIEDLAIDIILTEKISDPVCTYWHELWPIYCLEYHVEGWEDNGDGLLSSCDNIDLKPMLEGSTKKYHVERVTITLTLSNSTHTIYLEPDIGDAPVEDALVCLTSPWAAYWHEVYPEFCREYEAIEWNDNCNGVLDYCDWLFLQPINFEGLGQWWHVENVTYDILVRKLIHDVAVINVHSRFNWVYQGDFDPIDVTVENQGDFTETVNVTAYYDGIRAAPMKQVQLNPGEKKTLTFFWNTAGVPPGFYTVSAYAAIPLDDDPADNQKIGNTEEVRRLPWYVKASYPDYAISGMPDFDQRQWGTYNWTDPWGAWSHCGPVAIANSIWWFDSKYEYIYNPNSPPPPAMSDSFPLVQAYGPWDDHDPSNVQPLVEHLAWLMDCDGRRTGVLHSGTYVNDMEAGLAQYLSWSGVNPLGDVNGDGEVNQTDIDIVNAAFGSMPGDPNWNLAADIYPATVSYPPITDNIVDDNDLNLVMAHLGETGLFYEHTEDGFCREDFFNMIEEEVEKSQDVVLLLGIYYMGYREYGHYVTVAGVNSTTLELLISNPIRDDFEAGITPGRSPVPHTHLPPEPPYITHNNASLVSQDAYKVIYVPDHPSGYHWILSGYFMEEGWEAVIEYAVITSPRIVPDIAVINVTSEKTIVCQGYTGYVNATIENQGSITESSINIILYLDSSIAATYTIPSLAPGAQTTITFTLNATLFAKGNYTLSVYAEPLPGETEIIDNTYIDDWICIVIAGDVDANNLVNMLDLYNIALHYGATRGNPGYVANYDIDNNGIINMLDLYIAAIHFGETDP